MVRRPLISLLAGMMAFSAAHAQYSLQWQAAVEGQASTGTFAPYYMSWRQNGLTGVSPYAAYTHGSISRAMADSTRFSYGFGAGVTLGYLSPIDYDRYTPNPDESWNPFMNRHGLCQGDARLSQLYGEVKYRAMFLMAGMKDYDRSIFSDPLGAGDYVMSDNALPIPQIRLGFLDFTDVPFTRGWLQVQGELAYGKFTDSGWIKKQASHLTSFVTTGVWMHYKRWYFRIAPQQRFSVTLGLQHAAQFGGTQRMYVNGSEYAVNKAPVRLKTFFKILLPTRGEGSSYYDGNHLGSWDIVMRYRFDSGEVRLSAQWPWEDGSGIGKLNGWDGIWGVHYNATRHAIVDGVTLQYIDLTNQSGPMHWAPGDFPGTSIPGEATGADDYYNNFFYNGWANYGMSIGTPFLKSPAYNSNGYPAFADTRVRGVQAGIGGHPARRWQYRLLFSHRTSWGTPFIPAPHRRHDTSLMAECLWEAPRTPGLTVNGAVAFDHGRLYGNSFGVRVGVQYSGDMIFRKKSKP